MLPTNKALIITALLAALAGLAGYGLHAYADGAPTTQPLWYAGTALDAQGKPLDSTHNVSVRLFDKKVAGNLICRTDKNDVSFLQGRFRIALAGECVTDTAGTNGIQHVPDAWVEVEIDNKGAFERTKLGAVPYAIEAQHAVSSTTAMSSATVGSVTANFQMITATVTGGAGGSADTPCPAGYSLVMWSMSDVQLTQSGTGGWWDGTYGCDKVAGQLHAVLNNYANGSSQTSFSCVGLCVK